MPCHAMRYHTIPHHTIPYHKRSSVQLRSISYQITSMTPPTQCMVVLLQRQGPQATHTHGSLRFPCRPHLVQLSHHSIATTHLGRVEGNVIPTLLVEQIRAHSRLERDHGVLRLTHYPRVLRGLVFFFPFIYFEYLATFNQVGFKLLYYQIWIRDVFCLGPLGLGTKGAGSWEQKHISNPDVVLHRISKKGTRYCYDVGLTGRVLSGQAREGGWVYITPYNLNDWPRFKPPSKVTSSPLMYSQYLVSIAM